jgi:hypothetical protein
MQPIAAIARKKLGSTPGMQVLALPHKSTSDVGLIAAVRNRSSTHSRGACPDVSLYDTRNASS